MRALRVAISFRASSRSDLRASGLHRQVPMIIAAISRNPATQRMPRKSSAGPQAGPSVDSEAEADCQFRCFKISAVLRVVIVVPTFLALDVAAASAAAVSGPDATAGGAWRTLLCGLFRPGLPAAIAVAVVSPLEPSAAVRAALPGDQILRRPGCFGDVIAFVGSHPCRRRCATEFVEIP